MADPTPVRETKTAHGRVYQPAGYGRSILDWTPPAPLAGHRTLTRGVIKEMPTPDAPGGAPVVQFAEKAGGKVICVRITPERGTLVELVRIAEAMDAEIRAEYEIREVKGMAEHRAKLAADIAAFEATLPPGYIAIEDVEHNPNAADGWGLTRYRHEGLTLTYQDVDGLDARRHSPLGDPYQLVVYAPADRLAALASRKRSEAAAKEEARAAKKSAAEADRAAKIAQARETGQPVEIERWTEECDDVQAECDLDIIVRYAMPDGSTETRRNHTH